ncbi:hypothetical protein N9255_00510 [bacterium]|nr:hypothetical protein [bacterium]
MEYFIYIYSAVALLLALVTTRIQINVWKRESGRWKVDKERYPQLLEHENEPEALIIALHHGKLSAGDLLAGDFELPSLSQLIEERNEGKTQKWMLLQILVFSALWLPALVCVLIHIAIEWKYFCYYVRDFFCENHTA